MFVVFNMYEVERKNFIYGNKDAVMVYLWSICSKVSNHFFSTFIRNSYTHTIFKICISCHNDTFDSRR